MCLLCDYGVLGKSEFEVPGKNKNVLVLLWRVIIGLQYFLDVDHSGILKSKFEKKKNPTRM